MPTEHPLTRTLLAHCDDLVAYVQQRFPQRDFARDVIHDVCVQLLSDPPAVVVSKPLAYLRRMSLHRALDWCRRPAERRVAAVDAETLPEPVHHEDGACLLDFQQQLQALIAVIDAMPARARQCFLLYRIHDMAPGEIAEAIGISRNAVNHHICSAIRRIRERWEPARHYAERPAVSRARSRGRAAAVLSSTDLAADAIAPSV